MKHLSGLIFKKFDLHIHTPASTDFKDRSATVEDIIDEALSKDLTGIAITDHQTGRLVDEAIKIGKRKGLVVFPGVEIKLSGGKSGVHLLVIFDIDKNSEHIKQFLNTIQIYEQNGVPNNIASKSVTDVLEALRIFDSTAIASLAHCHSSQGVTGEMRGELRTKIFEPKYESLLGAEANESDFLHPDRKQNRTRVVDLFDGQNKDFHYKKLGVYQSSDAHSIADIGTSFTYFKVDNDVTIEDLRQCFINRDSRIRQSFEFNETAFPNICQLTVNQGFLDGQVFEFHTGLNCLLGGKGSGKSLTIELLRFCLNQPPLDETLRRDHDSKLETCLKSFGEVQTVIEDESGKRFKITRQFDPSLNNPTTIIDCSDNQEKSFAVDEIFPVLFLSQNEIVKIAEDRTGANTRKFIDRFFDFRKYHREIQGLTLELDFIDTQFADGIRAHTKYKQTQESISNLNEEIDKLDRLLNSEIFESYKESEKVDRDLEIRVNRVSEIKRFAETSLNDLKSLFFEDDSDVKNPYFRRVKTKAKEAYNSALRGYSSIVKELEKFVDNVEEIETEWKIKFEEIRNNYLANMREAGEGILSIEAARQEKNRALKKELIALETYQNKANNIEVIAKRRNEIVEKLEKTFKDYFQERRNKCRQFTELSNGSLRVTIEEGADTSVFQSNLSKLKRGSFLRNDDISLVTQNIRPSEFVKAIMRYEYKGRLDRNQLELIVEKTGLEMESVEKLVLHLLDNCSLEEILKLQHNSMPQDVPKIEYKVSGIYKDLNSLSVGQKATSLLLIALSEGTFPIVIDQPEDSLDLRTIWDDVCSKIRGAKDQRQFILTTHNSSVAVASDTDKFTIVVADANKGQILFSGSMTSKNIKKEVIEYLEGGLQTYQLKKSNYNI